MKIFKRAGAGLFAIFLMAISLTAIIPPQTARAAESDNERLTQMLCIFPSLSDKPGNPGYHVPKGWLSARILNRATIKLTFKPVNEVCKNNGRKIQYIDNTHQSKDFIDGFYYDENTSDTNFNYRRRSGNSQKDDSTIDEFEESNLPQGNLKGRIQILSTDTIRNLLSKSHDTGVEFTIGIEESALPNVDCREGKDNDNGSNFQLVDEKSGDKDFIWRCSGAGLRDDIRGYRLTKDSSREGIETIFTGKLEAFNITYNYNGTAITSVSSGHSLQKFTKCANDTYSMDCASTTSKYIAVSQAELDSKLGNDIETVNSTYGDIVAKLTMKDPVSGLSDDIIVAGARSESLTGSTTGSQQSETGNVDGDINTATKLKCELNLNPLTWLVCPLVAAANEMIDQLDNAIVHELNVDEDNYFDENCGGESNAACVTAKSFYSVWTNFRNIGLVLLVIAALVMVISQAMSMGPFDAYTVKKVLPRIVVAIIFMTLSWDICKYLIAVTNDIGLAVRTVIQSPFANVGNPNINVGTSVAGNILIAGAGIGLGIVGLLSLAVTGLLAVLVAFTVLIIRKIIIVFLVLVAPFAIACYILPNTQKAYKLWWDTLSKALLMFPIVMGFIAAGRVFAKVAGPVDADFHDGDILSQLVMMIAYFGPYFALPTAFKMAGGAIATITGMANDRSRGVFDRLRKGRSERMQDRFARARNGKLWDNKKMASYAKDENNNKYLRKAANLFGERNIANKAANWAVSPHKSLAVATADKKIPFLSAAGRGIKTSVEKSGHEQFIKLFQELNTIFGDNDKAFRVIGGILGGLSETTKEEFVRAGLATWETNPDGSIATDEEGNKKVVGRALTTEKEINTAADIMYRSNEHTEIVAASALHRSANRIATLHADKDMNYASVAAAAALGLGVHGFVNKDDIADIGRNITAETGDPYFADSALVQVEMAVAASMPHMKPGFGHRMEFDAKGNPVFKNVVESNRDVNVVGTWNSGSLAAAKSGTVSDMRGTIQEIVSTSQLREPDVQQIQVLQEQRNNTIKSIRAQIRAQNPGATDGHVQEMLQEQIEQTPVLQQVDQQIKQIRGHTSGAQAIKDYEKLKDSIARQRAAEGKEALPPKQLDEVIAADPANTKLLRTKRAAEMSTAFKQTQLFSAASRYSQASTDIKKEIMQIIESNPQLKAEFAAFEQGASANDPEIIGHIQAANAAVAQAKQPPIPGVGTPPVAGGGIGGGPAWRQP